MKTSVNTLQEVVIPFGDFTGLYRIYTLHNMYTVQVIQNNDGRLNGFQTTAHDPHPAREDICTVGRNKLPLSRLSDIYAMLKLSSVPHYYLTTYRKNSILC